MPSLSEKRFYKKIFHFICILKGTRRSKKLWKGPGTINPALTVKFLLKCQGFARGMFTPTYRLHFFSLITVNFLQKCTISHCTVLKRHCHHTNLLQWSEQIAFDSWKLEPASSLWQRTHNIPPETNILHFSWTLLSEMCSEYWISKFNSYRV